MGPKANYRPEIDGLRALAIIPVVLFHAGVSAFQGGFVGVDIFFVISGYLITRLLLADLDQGRLSIVGFYERRARRILPALFVMILCCVPFAWFWMLPSQFAKFGDSMISVAGFVSNILFWRQDGYFDEAAEFKPLLHTWSLAVEEQFYIFFPLTLVLARKLQRRTLVVVILATAVLSYLICVWGSFTAPAATFYLAPTRAWELLAGSLCAFVRPRPVGHLNEGLAASGLVAIFWAMTSLNRSAPNPSAYTLIPVVGTVLVILFARERSLVARLLSLPVLVWLGLISYSTYLWHQPLFAFARLATPGEPGMVLVALLALVSFAAGYVSWRYVERPFRRPDRRWCDTPIKMFAFSGVGILIIAATGVTLSWQKGFVAWVDKKPLAYLEYSGRDLAHRTCSASELVAANLTYCRLPASGEPDAALIGDSHADDKLYGLDSRDTARRWMLLANSSCPPLLNVDVVSAERRCAAKMEAAINYVVGKPDIRTVALSFFGSYPLARSYAADHFKNRFGPENMQISSKVYPQMRREELFAAGIDDAVTKLVAAGKEVIIFVDQPELPFLPLDCIKGAPRCSVPIAQVMGRQELHRKQLSELKRAHPTIRIFDPLPTLCDEIACSYKKNGEVMYRDSHHLSLVGSERLAEGYLGWFNRSRVTSTQSATSTNME